MSNQDHEEKTGKQNPHTKMLIQFTRASSNTTSSIVVFARYDRMAVIFTRSAQVNHYVLLHACAIHISPRYEPVSTKRLISWRLGRVVSE